MGFSLFCWYLIHSSHGDLFLRFTLLFEILRLFSLTIIIIYNLIQNLIKIELFHYISSNSYKDFALFFISFIIFMKFYILSKNPERFLPSITLYYKYKIFATVLWSIETLALTFTFWRLNKIKDFYIDSIFVLIGIVTEVYFLAGLKKFWNLASVGDFTSFIKQGIRIILRRVDNVRDLPNETVVAQSSEVSEEKSYSIKEMKQTTVIPENRNIKVIDFTVKEEEIQ